MKFDNKITLVVMVMFVVLASVVSAVPPDTSACAQTTNVNECTSCCNNIIGLGNADAQNQRLARLEAKRGPDINLIAAFIRALPIGSELQERIVDKYTRVWNRRNNEVLNLNAKVTNYNTCLADHICSDVKPDLAVVDLRLSEEPKAGDPLTATVTVKNVVSQRAVFQGSLQVVFFLDDVEIARTSVSGQLLPQSHPDAPQSQLTASRGLTFQASGNHKLKTELVLPLAVQEAAGASVENNKQELNLCVLNANGEDCPATVGGKVFLDQPANSAYDPGEELPGRLVILTNKFTGKGHSSCTNAAGSYIFDGVLRKTSTSYRLSHPLPPSCYSTSGLSSVQTFSLTSAQLTKNFGIKPQTTTDCAAPPPPGTTCTSSTAQAVELLSADLLTVEVKRYDDPQQTITNLCNVITLQSESPVHQTCGGTLSSQTLCQIPLDVVENTAQIYEIVAQIKPMYQPHYQFYTPSMTSSSSSLTPPVTASPTRMSVRRSIVGTSPLSEQAIRGCEGTDTTTTSLCSVSRCVIKFRSVQSDTEDYQHTLELNIIPRP